MCRPLLSDISPRRTAIPGLPSADLATKPGLEIEAVKPATRIGALVRQATPDLYSRDNDAHDGVRNVVVHSEQTFSDGKAGAAR
jgi:hypothetical protein